MDLSFHQVLDCSGLCCPLPILRTRAAVSALQIGQILKMISTDLGTATDIYAWVRRTGHELLARIDEGESFIFYIRKAY
jgi:tRNA 2-thiouridine synthesizing protein A